MRMQPLQETTPAWPRGTLLRVAPPGGLAEAPVYIWDEKSDQFVICAYLPAGTLLTYVKAWALDTYYAECSYGGAPAVLLQSTVEPVERKR